MRGKVACGQRIRRRRREFGMTQEQLAERVGCDVKTIRNAESSRNLDTATLQRIAKSLDLDWAFIVEGSPDPSLAVSENRCLVKRWIEAVNKRDLVAIVACYDPQCTLKLPSGIQFPGSGVFEGGEAIRGHYEQLIAIVRFDLTQIGTIGIHPNSNVIFFRGTLSGEVLDTGATVASEIVCEFQMISGLIMHHLVMLDTASFAMALGPNA